MLAISAVLAVEEWVAAAEEEEEEEEPLIAELLEVAVASANCY